MSRIPLALKYRPRTFEQVVGQRHVTETLRNALRGGRVASAYLFAGPRGSGKTTTARLLARAVNCTDLRDGEPCGVCDLCVSILSGRSLDVIEIDAASNRGIEDVRELRERVGYAAVQGSKKIYIVDEVHMLSKDAFNALLKTIEEPPPHVVFVFATTDPQKVLPTVVSRCQRFDFKRIPLKDVEARLREICEVEGHAITPEAVFLIAKRSDGSLRDALGMLDQVLALGEAGAVDAQRVRDVLGLAGLDLYLAATDAMRRRDPAAAIRFVRGLVEDGIDLLDFYGGLYEHLRNLMLFALPGGEAAASVPADFHAAYRETAEAIGFEDLLRATQILTDYEFAFRGTSHPEYMLEFLLVRLALLEKTADVAKLLAEVRAGGDEGGAAVPASRGKRTPRVEAERPAPRAGSGTARPVSAAPAAPPEGPVGPRLVETDAPAVVASPSASGPAGPTRVAADEPWEAVLDSVSRRKASLAGMLAGLDHPALQGDELVLSVPGDQAFVAEALRETRNQTLLEEVLASLWPGARRLRLEVGSAGHPAAGAATAFRRLDRDDPLVQRVLEVFDADYVS
jgi:DNA polymerase-3 subunit gamma/tau